MYAIRSYYEAYYYLVRADNDCSGEGPLGWDSDGNPRQAPSVCP